MEYTYDIRKNGRMALFYPTISSLPLHFIWILLNVFIFCEQLIWHTYWDTYRLFCFLLFFWFHLGPCFSAHSVQHWIQLATSLKWIRPWFYIQQSCRNYYFSLISVRSMECRSVCCWTKHSESEWTVITLAFKSCASLSLHSG